MAGRSPIRYGSRNRAATRHLIRQRSAAPGNSGSFPPSFAASRCRWRFCFRCISDTPKPPRFPVIQYCAAARADRERLMMRNELPYDNVLETIGWTPMIRLNRVTRGVRTPILAKAEFFNPGGSLKDRSGVPIIQAAERDGRLQPGGTIVQATRGNTGIGLAIAAAAQGYRR